MITAASVLSSCSEHWPRFDATSQLGLCSASCLGPAGRPVSMCVCSLRTQQRAKSQCQNTRLGPARRSVGPFELDLADSFGEDRLEQLVTSVRSRDQNAVALPGGSTPVVSPPDRFGGRCANRHLRRV